VINRTILDGELWWSSNLQSLFRLHGTSGYPRFAIRARFVEITKLRYSSSSRNIGGLLGSRRSFISIFAEHRDPGSICPLAQRWSNQRGDVPKHSRFATINGVKFCDLVLQNTWYFPSIATRVINFMILKPRTESEHFGERMLHVCSCKMRSLSIAKESSAH